MSTHRGFRMDGGSGTGRLHLPLDYKTDGDARDDASLEELRAQPGSVMEHFKEGMEMRAKKPLAQSRRASETENPRDAAPRSLYEVRAASIAEGEERHKRPLRMNKGNVE